MDAASPLAAGRPYPLGAHCRDGGVNFCVFSAHAEALTLCVYDAQGEHELSRHAFTEQRDGLWHGFLPGAGAGLVYGLRAHGRYQPEAGHRFNPHKLLLDPAAREIVGRFAWRDEHFGWPVGHPDEHRAFDTRDNGRWALKARVAAPLPPLPAPAAIPHRPLAESVLYELHVKGFSRLNEAVPAPLRGTYAGLAHQASIAHLTRLGITAVSLLPVHYALPEQRLVDLGLTNYWGYNTLGFFAPDPRLSATPQDPTATRHEFRAMVEALPAAQIEVILDVVYNHTAESDERGPTLSFRGLDNAAWYRLPVEDRSRYDNFIGCGNTLNLAHPRVAQFVLDSLRHWVSEYRVDGFRFDLAPVLGRGGHAAFEPQAAFFALLEQDPQLARCKLIAEPWDVGPHGYQLGRFSGRFAEWNDRFRDSTRLYWLSRGVGRGEFARRLLASSDKFHHGTRRPSASINFVAAHDGFTLRDVVSYAHKHNQANGEHNRDGHHANFSTNCGVEGPTDDAGIVAQRRRLARALLATALLAQGTPMLLAGDEFGHTQRGNNNAYCQDNATTWLDWPRADAALIDFTARLVALRRSLPALRQDRWLSDAPRADGGHDVQWLSPAGRAMTVDDWHDSSRHALGLLLAPAGSTAVLLLANAEPQATRFTLPAGGWRRVLDSSTDALTNDDAAVHDAIDLPPHALLLLTHGD